MSVKVEVITEVTDELTAAFGRLVPQLSRSAPPLGRAALAVAWVTRGRAAGAADGGAADGDTADGAAR